MRDNPGHDRHVMGRIWCYPSESNRNKFNPRPRLILQKAKERNSQMEGEKEDN